MARMGQASSGARRSHARRPEALERRQKDLCGSRCASSASVRSSTTTCRARGFATRDLSALAPWTKGASDCRYDQLEVTAAYAREGLRGGAATSADAAPSVRSVVRIERFLSRSQVDGHVLKVHPNPRPRAKPATHGIDEHIFGGQMRGCLGVTRPPTLEAREPIVFSPRAADLDQGTARRTPPRRCRRAGHRAASVVRRPRSSTVLALLARG